MIAVNSSYYITASSAGVTKGCGIMSSFYTYIINEHIHIL